MRRFPVVLWVLLGAVPALHAGAVEITPHFGYRFGGELDSGENTLFDYDVEIDKSVSVGVTIGVPIRERLRIELLVSHQDTRFTDEDGLFRTPAALIDVELTYYQLGASWTWDLDRVRPYVAGGLGVANIDPQGPGTSDHDRFSVSLGGGAKLMVAKHVGFRFEARAFLTDVENDFEDNDCCHEYDDEYDEGLFQGELSAGLVLSF